MNYQDIDTIPIEDIFRLFKIDDISKLSPNELQRLIAIKKAEFSDDIRDTTEFKNAFEIIENRIFDFLQQYKNDIKLSIGDINRNSTNKPESIMSKILQKMEDDIMREDFLEQQKEEELRKLPKMWELSKQDASIKSLNPIGKIENDKIICVDTRFTDYVNSNDITITLNEEIKNVTSMEVITLEVPNNRYQFNEGYNSFTVTEIDYDVDTNTIRRLVYPVILSPGNYGNNRDIETYLSEEYNREFVSKYGASNPDPQYDFVNTNFRVFGKYDEVADFESYVPPRVVFQVNERTGIATFYAKAKPNNLIELEFNPNPENPFKDIGYLMGFTQTKYYGKSQYHAERVYRVNGLSYFYLAIDEFNNNRLNTIVNNNIPTNMNIIGRFGLISQRFGENFDEKRFNGSFGRNRKYTGPVNIKRLHFKLIDEFGEPLDIKNADWYMSLLFKYKYTDE